MLIPHAAATVFEKLLEERTGQRLGEGRQWRIDTALTPVAHEFGVATPAALVALLVARTPRLADRIVDALVNGESSFFRDMAVFQLLRELIADLSREVGGRPLRIWSAGCSTGQEPLSLAILAAEAGIAVEIAATDVSAAAIARARAGRYSQFEIQRGLSVHRMVRWFQPEGAEWVVDPVLAAMVRCRVAGLLEPSPAVGVFDLVLCRNVLFYLTPEARGAALGQLRRALRPGGRLVLGAGETLLADGDGFAADAAWRGVYAAADAGRTRPLAARGRAA